MKKKFFFFLDGLYIFCTVLLAAAIIRLEEWLRDQLEPKEWL